MSEFNESNMETPEAIVEDFKKKLKENPDTTERKGLLWGHKMKQHLD